MTMRALATRAAKHWPAVLLAAGAVVAIGLATLCIAERARNGILIRDVTYAPEHGERGRLDIMLPEGEGPFPVVVCIHGGGWYSGSKWDIRPTARRLRECGIATVIPNYRLSTTASHPAQFDDMLAVMDWLARHGADFHLDLSRVGLTGRSAGGHLAALVALQISQEPDPRYHLRCVAPFAAVTDLRLALQRPRNERIVEMIESLVGGPAAERVDLLAEASPIMRVNRNMPPTLLIHGADDPAVPASQAVAFADTLRQLGVDARACIVPGAGHDPFGPNADPARTEAAIDTYRTFLREHLTGDVP